MEIYMNSSKKKIINFLKTEQKKLFKILKILYQE